MSTEIDNSKDEFESACATCECADHYGMAPGRVYCWVDHVECSTRTVCGRVPERMADRLACYDALTGKV